MRQKSKWTVFLTMSLMTSIFLMGCNEKTKLQPLQNSISPSPNQTSEMTESTYNSIFEKYDDNITELGIVINTPDQEVINSVSQIETYKQMDTKDHLLIIPKYNGSKITISKVEYTGERFIAKDILYAKEGTPEGYGLLLYTIRPEGIPEVMVTITYKNKSIDYVIAEDGKNGHEGIEYLKLETEDINTSYLGEMITPIQDTTYLEGLNRFSSYSVDFDLDGNNEVLEVYCQGEMTEDGTYLLDDGQVWSLVIRKGKDIYPLFEKSYIQLGGLEYLVYKDYDDYEKIHVLIQYKAGAGMMTFDCVYDEETGNFRRDMIYEASNISVLKDWK